MVFELTDSLQQKIVQALENQEEKFLVDAEAVDLVAAGSAGLVPDDEKYFSLPGWDSGSGFELRQNFVNNLRSPVVKDELQQILHSGRGVFKSFKNKLKDYPQVEKLWHSFKDRKMNAYVHAWYNELCEVWGLEKLKDEPEDREDLINDDFSFRPYDFTADEKTVIDSIRNSSFGSNCKLPETVNEAVFELWQHQFFYDRAGQKGFICQSMTNEFAGCVTVAPVITKRNNEKAAVITSFFVPEKFRGLGIGTELMEMCMDSLKGPGFKWVLLTQNVPEAYEKLFTGFNFFRTDSGLMAELTN